eukprot:symbB.v1.2.012297.t2/scaffold848.1/size158107/8
MAELRSYESLQAKLVGMENMIEQMIGQVTVSMRKEIRTAEDRLRRQIESDRKDEAAEMHKVKAAMILQISNDVQAAEDRVYRRFDSERLKQKEMIAELRRETSSQIAAQQDTASFTTQRVVPKETEEMAALRSAMEDIRSLAETSQKDVNRLAQDLADQRRFCDLWLCFSCGRSDAMQISMQQLPKHHEDMLTLKLAVEKADNLAQHAKKLAEKEVTLGQDCQEQLAGVVGDLDAELRSDMRQMVGKVHSDIMLEMDAKVREIKETSWQRAEDQVGRRTNDTMELIQGKVKKLEDSHLELRLAKLEALSQRAAKYSDAGEATLFTTGSSRRPLGAYGDNKQVIQETKISESQLSREERREERERRKERDRRPPMDGRNQIDMEAVLQSLIGGQKPVKAAGEVLHEDDSMGLVSEDLKIRLEGLLQQFKDTLNPDNFPSIMADASAVDYENFGDGEVDVQAEYQDGQQGFEEQEGYQAYPQMDYGNYMPNGQLANGHMHNGQMPMYPPQGIRSDGQVPYGQYDQQYVEPYMPQVPLTPMMPPQTPLVAQPLQHFVQAPMAQMSATSHARCCGSIALPISREAERFMEQDHAMSEYGAGMGQYPQAQAEYGAMGSLDGEAYAGENGGGYEALYEQPGYIDVPQVPYTAVSYGPPTVVGVGNPVVHSVTTRVGRPMSPVREHSPVRGRGASPVRGASPIRGAPGPMTPGNPRHRELSPLRSRSVGEPQSFAFQPGMMPNMSPVPVSVVTQGAPSTLNPPTTIKETPPKEEESSSDEEEEEKPSRGTTLFSRL